MTGAKRGRPRLIGQRRSGATPEEEILDAAAELFAANGFAATSTRMIAEAVGMRQASLYHHFATKDDILDCLLVRTVDKPLTLARWLARSDHPAPARLYALVWFDVHQLLASKWNLGVLLQLPETRDPKFAQFYRNRGALRDCYLEVVNAAIGVADSTVLPSLPFHFVESAIQLRLDEADVVDREGADTVATSLSDAVLRTVGRAEGLEQVRVAARALLASFDAT